MIAVEGLCLRAGAFALDGVGFTVAAGEYAVLMGKTGSGKTSILEAICGLRPIRAGAIRVLDRDVTNLAPGDRGLGYVPQDRALFSTMTVREHLAFGPTVRRWGRAEIGKRVDELATLLGIGALLQRQPHGLSGGESQRVALGRALAARPGVLLLDEPLSALDEETREEIMELLGSICRKTGVTVLHVTHSRAEARRLADRVFILDNGQVGSAEGSAGRNGEPGASAPVKNDDI